MNKLYVNAEASIANISNGLTIMAGGFGLCGIPENLIDALLKQGTRDLTFISNNTGVSDFGMGKLLQTRQIRKLIGSYVGENRVLEEQALNKKTELELNPQGTLAERIRAGGAGIPEFYTPSRFGTVAEGKETREFCGRKYVAEQVLIADFAFVKGWRH